MIQQKQSLLQNFHKKNQTITWSRTCDPIQSSKKPIEAWVQIDIGTTDKVHSGLARSPTKERQEVVLTGWGGGRLCTLLCRKGRKIIVYSFSRWKQNSGGKPFFAAPSHIRSKRLRGLLLEKKNSISLSKKEHDVVFPLHATCTTIIALRVVEVV